MKADFDRRGALRRAAAAGLAWGCGLMVLLGHVPRAQAQAQRAGPGQPAAASPARTLAVGVDSALAAAMPALAKAFEVARPGLVVKLLPGASVALLEQLAQQPRGSGSGFDLLAGIDSETAATGLQRHLLLPDLSSTFASNTLVLVVPAQPLGAAPAINRLADLARPEVQRIAMGRQTTLASGRYAREVINSQRLWPSLQRKLVLADEEAQLLQWLGGGDVQAGFVLGSTAAAAGPALRVVQVLETVQPLRHQAFVAAVSAQPALAAEFVQHLRSVASRAELQRLGFGPP